MSPIGTSLRSRHRTNLVAFGILKTVKANYGPIGKEIELTWRDGVFVRDMPNVDPIGQATEVFLRCLDKRDAEGRYASSSSKSENYAPKIFAGMPEGRGYTKAKFQQAMEELFSKKTIRIGEHRKANRHSVEIIVRTGS